MKSIRDRPDLAEGQGDRYGEAGIGEGRISFERIVHEHRALRRPPLSCRTSPPQGGRLAARIGFRRSATLMIGERPSDVPISPLEGEMSGRTEGGNVGCPTFWETMILQSSPQLESLARRFARPIAAIASRVPTAPPCTLCPRRPSSGVAVAASPATASRHATPSPLRSAVSLTSAMTSSSQTARRHRRQRDILAPASLQPGRCDPSANRSASGRVSAISRDRGRPAAPVSTGTPVRTAIPSASTSRESPSADFVCQPPDLKTSPGGDFDDAVAVP